VDILRPVRAFDRFQQRHTTLAIPMAVIRKMSNDQGGSLAALVAYYAFFSLFPLLLVMTTILGFILQGHSNWRTSVVTTIRQQIPVVGKYISPEQLKGSIAAIVIGLVTSLLAGFGVTNAAQNAFDRVWAVPFKERPDFLHARLRGLVLFVSLGLLFILATGVSGLVSAGVGGTWAKPVGIAISLLVNFCLFLAAFRFMTAAVVGTSCLWIGVIFASVFWEILQVVGGIYIGHVVKHSKNYGVFGIVIALLVFMHLGAQMTLYAAEINVVIKRRLWPRSLLGPPTEPADQETLTALAKVEERHETERVEVEFEPVEPQKS
jgi:membrane protein